MRSGQEETNFEFFPICGKGRRYVCQTQEAGTEVERRYPGILHTELHLSRKAWPREPSGIHEYIQPNAHHFSSSTTAAASVSSS